MQVQHEACTFRKLLVNLQITIHLQGHLLTCWKTQSIALSQVLYLQEGLEDVLVLLFRNMLTRIRHQELIGMRTAFLEVQPDVSIGRGIFWSLQNSY